MTSLFNSEQPIKMEMHSEIMSRLKFIGNIQEGEKINVKNLYIQPNGIITKIARTLYSQDNRSNTLNFITNTIKESFNILNLYANSDQHTKVMMCYNIYNDLKNVTSGLENLKKTYVSDLMFCCRITGLIQEINIILTDVKDKLNNNN
jgi:hypothetical protein